METRNKSTASQPSVMWDITDLCNYKCEYCYRTFAKNEPHYGHINDSTIGAVLNILSALPGSWQIKVGGTGEPTIHPRFLDICREVKKLGHTLCLTTNLSVAYGKLEEFIDICSDKLDFVTASLHLSQIDLDEFINKAIRFNSIKHPRTNFTVTSVVTERNLSQLKEIKEWFNKKSIRFRFQVLKIDGKFVKYSKETEDYICGNLLRKTDMIRGKNFFGTLCHSGSLFFIIRVNGDVCRCHSRQKLFYYMGNIVRGTFKRFSEPRPCLAQRCKCVAAVNRGMICFNERIDFFKMIYYRIACYLWPDVRRLIPSTSPARARKQ